MSCVLSLACTTDPILVNPDLAGDYFVKCKIWPGCKVGALVGKTRPQDISIDISGAQVVISNSDHSVMLSELKPGFYMDRDNALKIIPGKEHNLKVTLPDGHVMTAKTFIPSAFQLFETPDDTLLYLFQRIYNPYQIIYEAQPESASWSKSDHTLAYRFTLFHYSCYSFQTINSLPLIPVESIFSSETISSLIKRCAISITAYDSTFLPTKRWGLIESDIELAARLQSELNLVEGQNDNIQGGLGYFGAWTTIVD
ncbi:hypothetical protein GF406_13425, partial [candidate division KSB1 bacterium]|nr:hypothetical protein [candidate division KSB1 bacterium]